MEINCNYNEITGEILCNYPDNYPVTTQQDGYFEIIDAGGGNTFVVQKFVNYGDLMISFLLFGLFLLIFTKYIFDFWFSRSVRIKKYEL